MSRQIRFGQRRVIGLGLYRQVILVTNPVVDGHYFFAGLPGYSNDRF